MRELAEITALAIKPFIDKPFAVYGHSFGALVAFEVVRQLRRNNDELPLALFLGAHSAPQLPLLRRHLHDAPDAALIEELRTLAGTPGALLESREALEYLLPLLRADLQVCETYEYQDEEPLDSPIVVFGGKADPSVVPDRLEGWRQHTSADFAIYILQGGHFFLRSDETVLLRSISTHVHDRLLASDRLPAGY